MSLLKSLIKPQPFLSIGFLLLIIYVGIRAATIDMTHDEAYSFHNIKQFWHIEFLCTGNSHWLNSAAMKFSILLGFENVFFLRWFSLVSFIVTCLFGLWLLSSIKTNIIKLFTFSVLLLHPYFLDYFSLARGYAGGIMFQCLAFLCFAEGHKTNKRSFLFASLLFSGLSSIANYSFLCFFMAFTLIYFSKVYFSLGKSFLRDKRFYIDLLVLILISVIVGRALLFILKCSGDIVGAGEPDFLSMFNIFWDGLIYFKISIPILFQSIFSFLVFLVIIMMCLTGIIKKQLHNNIVYYSASVITILMFFIVTVSFLFFKEVYPYYRTALVLYIPALLATVSGSEFYFSKYGKLKPVLYGFSFLLIINFFISLNFKFCFDYRDQCDSKQSLEQLQGLNAKHIGISPELYGVYANYYQASDTKQFSFAGERIETYLPKGVCATKNKLAEFDYLVLFPPYDLSFYKNSEVHLEYVSVSPLTKNIIVRVQKKP